MPIVIKRCFIISFLKFYTLVYFHQIFSNKLNKLCKILLICNIERNIVTRARNIVNLKMNFLLYKRRYYMQQLIKNSRVIYKYLLTILL